MVADTVIRTAVALSALVLAIVLLSAGAGLIALPIAMLCAVVSGAALNFSYIRRRVKGFSVSPHAFDPSVARTLLTFGGYLQLGRVGNAATQATDSVLIAAVLGAAHVVPYAMTSKLAVLFGVGFASKAPIAMFPMLSEMHARGESASLQRAFLGLVGYSTRLAVGTATFLLLANHKFVELWVGGNYFGGPLLNLVFISWVLLESVYRGTLEVMLAAGGVRRWALLALLEGVINVAVSFALVQWIGLVGIAIGTTVAKLLTTGTWGPYLAARAVGVTPRTLFWEGIGKPLMRSLPAALCTILVAWLLPESLAWRWVIAVGVVAVIANVACFEASSLRRFSPLRTATRFMTS
jgi:O-antigen/teichoic acid export membrane protein